MASSSVHTWIHPPIDATMDRLWIRLQYTEQAAYERQPYASHHSPIRLFCNCQIIYEIAIDEGWWVWYATTTTRTLSLTANYIYIHRYTAIGVIDTVSSSSPSCLRSLQLSKIIMWSCIDEWRWVWDATTTKTLSLTVNYIYPSIHGAQRHHQ